MNIALVEDEDDAADVLLGFLRRYGQEKNIDFSTSRFDNAVTFLTNYKANYDLIFMDIEMPMMKGIDAAKKLRELDKNVLLIFVTNMAQYAINGYEVSAFDYAVKPILYHDFCLKMQRVQQYLEKNKEMSVCINTEGSIVSVDLSDIKYVEVSGHKIYYHTTTGILESYGTLKKIEANFPPHNFVRANSCYLVNLKYVRSIKGFTAVMSGGDTLQISESKKKPFLQAIASYLGNTGGKTDV